MQGDDRHSIHKHEIRDEFVKDDEDLKGVTIGKFSLNHKEQEFYFYDRNEKNDFMEIHI